MPANTSPIYTLTPNFGGIGNSEIKTANTAKDGTGTVVTAFTAGSNGSFVQSVRFRALGTNIATVARMFVNNGSATSTATNNALRDEITLSATTLSETSATSTYEIPVNHYLPAGYKLTFTVGTTVAAGYFITVIGGDY